MSIVNVTASATSSVQPVVAMAATATKSSGSSGGSADQTTMYPNPASRLDPELHMVILEFRNASGQITETLPTTQQLDQYRLNLTEGPAQQDAAKVKGWG